MVRTFHEDVGAGEREHYAALLFILLCVLFWGISFISTKVVLRQIPPATIVLYRQIIACLALISLLPFWRCPSLPAREDVRRIAASAFLGIVMYFILENRGLEHTTASNASLIVSALPIFTLFGEALLYHKKVGRWMMMYLLISIFGVYLVVSINGRLDLSSSQLFGNLLVLGAMACWVAYTLLNKGTAERYSSLNIIFYQSLAAVFLCICREGQVDLSIGALICHLAQCYISGDVLLCLGLCLLHQGPWKAGTHYLRGLSEPDTGGHSSMRLPAAPGEVDLDPGAGHDPDNASAL